jgi:pilus assembly protein CpaF
VTLREHGVAGPYAGQPAWLLGPLQPLVDDPAVTDVLVNGAESVWIDRGAGLEPVTVELGGEGAVRALAVRLAAAAGRRLDEGRPWVDARLPDGVRLHAVVPPVAPGGTHVSLRMLRPGRFDLAALEAAGSLPAGWSRWLAALVASRAAFLVTGGTGAGKTTLLATLLSLVPARERVVLVEDVGELHPVHGHVVRLEARHANVEGRGEVTLADLTRQALRMRPDRLVVGECRGPEVRDLLAALNTGHAGGCATLHANAAAEVPARLEALASTAGMSPASVAVQAAAAFDVVLHVRRERDRRYLAEIGMVTRAGSGTLLVRRAATWAGAGDVRYDEGVWAGLVTGLGLPERP